MKIPCKMCLKYPMCKHKSAIRCSLLHDYLVSYEFNKAVRKAKPNPKARNQRIAYLQKTLPEINFLQTDDGNWGAVLLRYHVKNV